MGLLGIPQERIAQRLGVSQDIVSSHLHKSSELKNGVNSQLERGFGVNTITEQLGWPSFLEKTLLLNLTGVSAVAYTKPVEIRFSRHARNKMRLYNLTPEEVEEVITSGKRLSRRDKQESQHGRLRAIWLMIGSYALVVTVIKTR